MLLLGMNSETCGSYLLGSAQLCTALLWSVWGCGKPRTLEQAGCSQMRDLTSLKYFKMFKSRFYFISLLFGVK